MLKQKLYQLKNDRAEQVEAATKALNEGNTEVYDAAMAEIEKANTQIANVEKLLGETERFGSEPAAGNPAVVPEGQGEDSYAKACKELADMARKGFPKVKAAEGMMSEGSDPDGGYTVPKDIVTKIINRRESKGSLLDLVTIHKTTMPSGRRTFKKRSQHQGFATVAEAAKMGKLATPQFETQSYEIEKRRGYLPVTNELLDDSDNNIAAVVEEWMGDEARVTANNEILTIIKSNPETDLVDLDGIIKAWIGLGSSFRATAKLVTNDDGLLYLGLLKDQNGRHLLTPNPADPHQLRLCVGPHILPVKVFDNVTIPSNGTKIPMILGDLKEGVAYWDRRQFAVKRYETGVVGDLNALEQDLTLWVGSLRDDCTIWDAAAFINGFIDSAAAPATGGTESTESAEPEQDNSEGEGADTTDSEAAG